MFNLFALGQEGLLAAETRFSIIANNINNLNTPGYHRQYVDMIAGGPDGMGVSISNVGQQLNLILTRQLQDALSRQNNLSTQNDWLGNISTQLDGSRLDDQFNTYFTAATGLANHPGDSTSQNNFSALADQMSHGLNDQINDLDASKQSGEQSLNEAANLLDVKARQLSELNKQITRARASSSQEPLELLDQREQLLTDMNQMADLKVVEQNGEYNVYLKSGDALVLGDRNVPINKKDIGKITGGSIGGLNTYLQKTLPKMLSQVQKMIQDFADENNKAFNSSSGKNLYDVQYDQSGQVKSISFNKDNFDTYIKGDESQGIDPAKPEDIAKFARATADLQTKGSSLKQYRSFVNDIGNMQAELKGNLKAQSMATLNISQTVQQQSGVDQNIEGLDLIQLNKYFQANSQIIKTANTLFDTILSLH